MDDEGFEKLVKHIAFSEPSNEARIHDQSFQQYYKRVVLTRTLPMLIRRVFRRSRKQCSQIVLRFSPKMCLKRRTGLLRVTWPAPPFKHKNGTWKKAWFSIPPHKLCPIWVTMVRDKRNPKRIGGYRLSDLELESFRTAFPHGDPFRPPFHLIEKQLRSYIEKCEEHNEPVSAKNILLKLESRWPRKEPRKLVRRIHAQHGMTTLKCYAVAVCNRFFLLQEAVRRDALWPGRGSLRVSRLFALWDMIGHGYLRKLRDDSLQELKRHGYGLNCYDDVHRLVVEMYTEFEKQRRAAIEVEQWLKSGDGPRAGTGNETDLRNPENINWYIEWLEEHYLEVETWLRDAREESVSPDPQECVTLVTIKEISEIVDLQPRSMSPYTKDWGKPVIAQSGRRRAQYCLDRILSALKKQFPEITEDRIVKLRQQKKRKKQS